MKNKLTLEKQKKIGIVLNIIIVVLVFILLIMMGWTVNSFRDAYTGYNAKSFSYNIEYRDFCGLVSKYYENISCGHPESKALLEYYGIAKFYEAATLYKAYDTVGDAEYAEIFRNKMKLAEGEMGKWIMLKDSILEELKIEER